MRQPPKNKRELLDRLDEIIRRGWYSMDVSRYSGSGAPGAFVEDLLGLTTGNKDIPDAVGWELKYYSPQTNLITLFHKEPNPKGVVRGTVAIDFDARENQPGSNALRNHGTKFRVAPEDVCRLYLKKERIG
ncbi:MAG: MvaI/BcnI family restriction endonuclease [Gammaproteobacteria bacterium]|nr:MvaI/BcnI family restriction endonuclease [Gammaproteobacteria bacterium]